MATGQPLASFNIAAYDSDREGPLPTQASARRMLKTPNCWCVGAATRAPRNKAATPVALRLPHLQPTACVKICKYSLPSYRQRQRPDHDPDSHGTATVKEGSSPGQNASRDSNNVWCTISLGRRMSVFTHYKQSTRICRLCLKIVQVRRKSCLTTGRRPATGNTCTPCALIRTATHD